MTNSPRVHMVGMGGIGMSGIAKLYLALGYKVQGSDVKKNEVLEELERLGAKVLVGHNAAHVTGVDFVVYSSSIGEAHPERVAAVKAEIPLLHRAEALAQLCEGRRTIAIAGTHGKTTTTALIGVVLKEASLDPSVVVGGLVSLFGGNACFGKGKDIVIEADESDSSFLKFSPAIEVITNIEEDHMEHFKNIENIEDAYRKFLHRLDPQGEWFGCAEDPLVLKLASENIRRCVLYGFNPKIARLYATDVEECPDGKRGVFFKAWQGKECLGQVQMKIIGRHNVLNALAAIGVGLKLGADFKDICRGLLRYEGAGRRFDVKYEDDNLLLVDDYAHHPTEIKKTLVAAKALSKKRIVALFQPHRYTRTEALMTEFASSFFDADKLIVTDVYAASEKALPGISGSRVCEEVKTAGHKDAVFVERARIAEYVRKEMKAGDLVIALGAGDIYQVAGELADFLKNRSQTNGSATPIFSGVRGRVLSNELLSKHTTLKVGGPAEYWIEPADKEDLRTVLRICKKTGMPIFFFGSGSNILPPDKGMSGAVIHLASPFFREAYLLQGRVHARAGLPNTLFIQLALQNGFGGFEFLSGIPGCIGGSIAMNAGSHGQAIHSILESVEIMDWDGKTKILKKEEIPFRYRSAGLEQVVILEGIFSMPVVENRKTQQTLDEYRDYRLKTQELHYPSAGCMFKNPQNSCHSSGKLIDDAGLKGRRVGNAQVSMKHANFMVNLGGATASDMKRLIEEVQKVVQEKYQVSLETEVKIL